MWKNLRTVWKFVIIFALLQVTIGIVGKGNILWVLFLTAFSWGVLLTIPCIIRYGLKRNIKKKWAVLYTILSAIVLLFGNALVSVIIGQTVTLWNLIMMIVSYYILVDEPIFSHKKQD